MFGSHFWPRSGAAEMSSPHQSDSAGTWFTRPPNVMYTDIGPWLFTFTPVGSRRISAGAGSASAARRSAAPVDDFFTPSS